MGIWATIAGCPGAPLDTRADEASLRAAGAALSKAVEEKDLHRIVSFYAEDAAVLPAASPIVSGKAAIRAEWTRILAIPGYRNTSELRALGISRSGDLACAQGAYAASLEGRGGTPPTERGKWVSVWRKQPDGSWKRVLEIYNTDAPPPEHKGRGRTRRPSRESGRRVGIEAGLPATEGMKEW